MKEALFYQAGKEGNVHCSLCAQYCAVKPGERGKCGVRENRDGILYTLVYGKAIATHVDPIEKKPLFHFLPGARAYSIATVGCNFKCRFCQNCEISLPGEFIQGRDLSPAAAVAEAVGNRCEVMAYTYTEPTIFFEYALDMAKAARGEGLKNVFVTNGFITRKPLEMIAPFLDAANIDLKSFDKGFYKDVVGGRLEPVLDAIKLYHELGIFIEITTLVIPGGNDSDRELTGIAEFLAAIDPDIPWHVSRFHPAHQMPATDVTPVETLLRAVQRGKEAGLHYIYAGNIPGNDFESTYCPRCSAKVIDRFQYQIRSIDVKNSCCPVCQTPIKLVFLDGRHPVATECPSG